MSILESILYQLVFTVGIIIAFGLIIAFCRRLFVMIVGYKGPAILLATGIVGTPIHELSHALMCLIFGHRITEIKLFTPGSSDGVLGYVNHSYNPRNLYHQIGNFFIGVAPIIGGSGALLLLLRFMVPETFSALVADLSTHSADLSFVNYFAMFGAVFKNIFTLANLSNVWWWIFILLAISISSHMELSPADIKGSLGGFCLLTVIFVLMDVVLYIINPALLSGVTGAITSVSVYIAGFLAISGVFSLALVALAFILRLFIRR